MRKQSIVKSLSQKPAISVPTSELAPNKRPGAATIPDYILKQIVEYITENDHVSEQQARQIIQASTPERNFERYCEWNGIIGYADRMVDALDSLRAFADADGEL